MPLASVMKMKPGAASKRTRSDARWLASLARSYLASRAVGMPATGAPYIYACWAAFSHPPVVVV